MGSETNCESTEASSLWIIAKWRVKFPKRAEMSSSSLLIINLNKYKWVTRRRLLSPFLAGHPSLNPKLRNHSLLPLARLRYRCLAQGKLTRSMDNKQQVKLRIIPRRLLLGSSQCRPLSLSCSLKRISRLVLLQRMLKWKSSLLSLINLLKAVGDRRKVLLAALALS